MGHTLILLALVMTQALGDIWLSQGMKIYGEVTSYAPEAMLELFSYLFTSIWFYLGLGSLAFSWLLYLVAVSKMDLSYLLPIHASSYILNAVFAWLLLEETVSPLRWLATFTIAIGVLIVGWSEYRRRQSAIKLARTLALNRQKITPLMSALPSGFYLPKFWLGVILLVLMDSTGDLLTAKGMKEVGSIHRLSLMGICRWIGKIATNPSMLGGIFAQAMALLMFISLLSWDDISLVRPATAMGYIVSLLGARFILHEKVSRGRLIGITIIGCGVSIVSLT